MNRSNIILPLRQGRERRFLVVTQFFGARLSNKILDFGTVGEFVLDR